MRCVLVIVPRSSCGTLKSTRIRTRLPLRSSWSTASLGIVALLIPACGLAASTALPLTRKRVNSLLADHVLEQIDAALRIAPFVVVPADELEEAVVQLDAAARVEDARMRIMNEVRGDHFFIGVRENPLQVVLAGTLHRRTDVLVACLLHRAHGQIDHRH